MNREAAEEYTASLGQIAAGAYRQVMWAQQQGVPKALGLTTEEWVEGRLGGYVRLGIAQRREAVKELTEEGLSTRDQAAVLGVDQSTVVRDQAADANASLDGEGPPSGRAADQATDANASLDATPESTTGGDESKDAAANAAPEPKRTRRSKVAAEGRIKDELELMEQFSNAGTGLLHTLHEMYAPLWRGLSEEDRQAEVEFTSRLIARLSQHADSLKGE